VSSDLLIGCMTRSVRGVSWCLLAVLEHVAPPDVNNFPMGLTPVFPDRGWFFRANARETRSIASLQDVDRDVDCRVREQDLS
jgi:hypothetical protein